MAEDRLIETSRIICRAALTIQTGDSAQEDIDTISFVDDGTGPEAEKTELILQPGKATMRLDGVEYRIEVTAIAL